MDYNIGLYNRLYKGPRYDSLRSSHSVYKYDFIDKFMKKIPKKRVVLDIGSGRGYNTFRLLEEGRKVVAVDFCEIVNTYKSHRNLSTYRMEVLDFLLEVIGDGEFELEPVVLCSGMIEHVLPHKLNDILKGLAGAAPDAFYGVANHSDRAEGHQLHLIRESSDWWLRLMKRYYSKVELVPTKFEERFFFIECHKPKVD